MELYKEILIKILENEKIEIIFQNLKFNANELVEMKCYDSLMKIKAILSEDNFDDAECFLKIESIVNIFEGIGSNAGNRHDFW